MSGIHGWDTQGTLREILVSIAGRLRVEIDAFTASLPVGANLIGRVDARNGDKLASMTAPYAVSVFDNNTPAAGITLNSPATPAGTYRHITAIAASNVNTNPASVNIFAGFSGLVSMPLLRVLLPGAAGIVVWNGHVVLRPGDNVFVQFGAGALNDDTYLRACGWDETT